MPIYEYYCNDCGRKSSFLILNVNKPFTEKCSHCGSTSLCRIMSRFASIRSNDDRLESMADPSKWGGLDENDPRSIERFVKKMGKEMGEELGEDVDQLAEEAAREAEQISKGESSSGSSSSPDSSGDVD